ncbi:MAG: CBS domain-containing protein, partial [Pseudomonadota bacterium]
GRRRRIGLRDAQAEVIGRGEREDQRGQRAVPGREALPDVVKRMRAAGVRRLPVVDREGTLVGILTVDDLLDLLSETLNDLTRLVTRELTREQRRRP